MKHSRLRVADDDLKKTKQEGKGNHPPAGKLTLPDGSHIPDPETAEGRKEMMRQVANQSISLKTRAQLVEKFVNRALDAADRQAFKAAIEELADNIAKLKSQDVPQITEALVNAYKTYEEARKVQNPAGRSSIASYRR